jgi:DNA-binding transcriptional LysR family regulator
MWPQRPLPVRDYSDASGIGRSLRSRKREIFADGTRGGGTRHVLSIVFTRTTLLMKTMTLAGRGIAWLRASLVEHGLAEGTLVVAGEESWRVTSTSGFTDRTRRWSRPRRSCGGCRRAAAATARSVRAPGFSE